LAEDDASATLAQVILDDIPAGGHHQGGRMRIGPDGLLYVGVGAFEPSVAQDPNSLAGKLLRMNLDGSIPADNPDAESLVFISGIRNTQGYDWFDEGNLLIMDHGPTGLELDMPDLQGLDEFNVAQAGDNLGWVSIWGCAQGEGLVEPVMVWDTAVPPAGATVYTGTAIPEWTGSFMVASLGGSAPLLGDGRHLHRIELNPDNPYIVEQHEVYLQSTYERLRTVAMGNDGHLYLTTSNCDGRGTCPPEGDLVLRIVGTM
jgi:glucose/arabinose dehydrogenase